MHRLSAIEVKNSLNLKGVRLSRNPLKRQAGHGHQMHGQDTLLLSKFSRYPFRHENGFPLGSHPAHNSFAGSKVGLGEHSTTPIHAHHIFKALWLLQKDEATLCTADFQGRVEYMVKRFLRRECFPPLILKIED